MTAIPFRQVGRTINRARHDRPSGRRSRLVQAVRMRPTPQESESNSAARLQVRERLAELLGEALVADYRRRAAARRSRAKTSGSDR